MLIPFNKPLVIGDEIKYIEQAINSHNICGDGDFTMRCSEILQEMSGVNKVLLTTSCTHATEMAALLSDISKGDEVIMPSYTFVSTANAFVLRGAVPVFVDIRPDTMNIDESLIEDAITARTKAIAVVHYAGVSCEMDTIMDIAKQHNLIVIEDAAQAIGSSYKGCMCGSIGDFGCLSFHETKNLSMGEGGALLIKDPEKVERAEIIREKGTNRTKFHRGEISKYTWVDAGSSYLPSELNAAYLYAQLLKMDEINHKRLQLWRSYYDMLYPLYENGSLELPTIPEGCGHNAHMFYIKCNDIDERSALIDYLRKKEILTVFHYVPLHSSPAGKEYGRFHGKDLYTTKESNRLLRLPMYYELSESDCVRVSESILKFYHV